MSQQWLAAENFERSHELISAINAVVINTQLSLSGKNDEKRRQEMEEARARLVPFIEEFDSLVKIIECDEDAPILSTDPRLTALTRQFVTVRQGCTSPILRDMALERAVRLLQMRHIETVPSDERAQLIEFLRALRSLLEDNSHADIIGLLGVI
jgi:hypothetical protein